MSINKQLNVCIFFFILSSDKTSESFIKQKTTKIKERSLLEHKNQRILFENLSFLQKNFSTTNLNANIRKENTMKIDFSRIDAVDRRKKEGELKFLYLQINRTKETCILEYEILKTIIFKYMDLKKFLFKEELKKLVVKVLDSWDNLIFEKIIQQNYEIENNLSIYENLNNEKNAKIKIEHSIPWSSFKKCNMFEDNLIEFVKIWKINNLIDVDMVDKSQISKILSILKEFNSLNLYLIFEMTFDFSNKKISFEIMIKIEKNFSFQFFQSNQAMLSNFNPDIADFINNYSKDKYIFPFSFGVNLSKNKNLVLGFQFFGNNLKENLHILCSKNLLKIEKIEKELTQINPNDFILELKFTNKNLIATEILFKEKKQKSDSKNKKKNFLKQNEIHAKCIESGWFLSYDNFYSVEKFKRIKYNSHKIENIFNF